MTLDRWSRTLLRPIGRFVLRRWVRHDEIVRLRQQIRYLAISHMLARSSEKPVDLTLFELSVFSQNGEDGVLQEILRRLGVSHGFFVEVGVSINESNCLLLADGFGWDGVLIESDKAEHLALERKYRSVDRIRPLRALVDRSNFASVLQAVGVPSEFEVLSIDIDGNDLWIWEGLKGFQPLVVIIEYNAALPGDRALAQPYDPHRHWDGTAAFGASIEALRRVGHEKGYRLVHTDLSGINAFFVRDDLAGSNFLPEEAVLVRAANYFLYGLGTPKPTGAPDERRIDR